MPTENDNGVEGEATGRVVGPKANRPRHSFGRACRRMALIVLGTYVGVIVLVGLLQSKLLYFPTKDYEFTPADVGLAFEELTLRTADGIAIAAWYVPHPNPKGTIIFCHGNAGNIADRISDLQRLHRMGVNVLIFDYRGYGQSEGTPSEKGTYADAEAAWAYVIEQRGEPSKRVVIFGRSLGGAVAIELAARAQTSGGDRADDGKRLGRSGQPAGLVVESTFTNIVDVGRLHYPWLPVNWIVTYRYESIDKVGNVTCPKLFFHGKDDSLIPIELGRRLFEAAAEPKTFVETPGQHGEAGYSYAPEFTQRLAAFLDGVLGGA